MLEYELMIGIGSSFVIRKIAKVDDIVLESLELASILSNFCLFPLGYLKLKTVCRCFVGTGLMRSTGRKEFKKEI